MQRAAHVCVDLMTKEENLGIPQHVIAASAFLKCLKGPQKKYFVKKMFEFGVQMSEMMNILSE